MIRSYKTSDLEEVLDVWFQASQLAHSFLSAEFLTVERENIRTIYMPQTDTWVFEKDDHVVGFISLLGNEVGALFILPEHHREGIGRKLMNKARSLHDTLEVEVFEENPLGRAFYQSYGFVTQRHYLHESSGHQTIRLSYCK